MSPTKPITILAVFAAQLTSHSVFAEEAPTHSLKSSLYLLGNFAYGEPVYDLHVNYGYRLSEKGILLGEIMTCTYMGAFSTNGKGKNAYPGKCMAIGAGAGYQRFLWHELFATLYATPFVAQYYDKDYNKTQKGFQLLLRALVGYKLEFFSKHVFLEPALELSVMALSTNVPEDFKKVEKERGSKYSIGPNVYFGGAF